MVGYDWALIRRPVRTEPPPATIISREDTPLTEIPVPRPGTPRVLTLEAVSRSFYLTEVALMSAMVLVGFWPFFSKMPAGPRPWPPVIYVHAAVYLGWIGILWYQVVMAYRRRLRDHVRMGRFAIGYMVAIVAMGLVVSIAAPVGHVRAGDWPLDQAAGFLILPLGDMVLIPGLFAAAIAYRREPAVHKRLMVLTAIAFVFPAAARAGGLSPWSALAIWFLPLALAVAHDLATLRRIHPVYLVGTAILLLAFGRMFLMEWEPWLGVGRAILGPFLPGTAVQG